MTELCQCPLDDAHVAEDPLMVRVMIFPDDKHFSRIVDRKHLGFYKEQLFHDQPGALVNVRPYVSRKALLASVRTRLNRAQERAVWDYPHRRIPDHWDIYFWNIFADVDAVDDLSDEELERLLLRSEDDYLSVVQAVYDNIVELEEMA